MQACLMPNISCLSNNMWDWQACVDFSRSDLEQGVLNEQVNAFLTVVFELMEYVLYLRSFPCRCAVLLLQECSEEDKAAVLAAAKEEWEIVLTLESRPGSRTWLHQNCLHTTFQAYRELMLIFERNNYVMGPEIEKAVDAWFPSFSQSANLESVFREMEMSLRRNGFAQDSLPNLGCVAVRALERRICTEASSPKTIRLTEQDWTGKTIRGLKQRMFNPSSMSPCN